MLDLEVDLIGLSILSDLEFLDCDFWDESLFSGYVDDELVSVWSVFMVNSDFKKKKKVIF